MNPLRREGFDLLLVKLGVSLVPIARGTKVPIADFPLKKYLDGETRATETDLSQWQRFGYDRAAVLGKPSRGLFSLDFDNSEHVRKLMNDATKFQRENFTVKTSRGYQIWFRDPTADFDGLPSSIDARPKLEIELLLHHHLAQCPVNLHPSGITYTLTGATKILEKPGAINAFLERFESLGISTRRLSEKFRIKDVLKGISEGNRNKAAFQYVRYLTYTACLDADTMIYEVQRWNALNRPPLPEQELQNVILSAVKYPAKKEAIIDNAKWTD